MKTAHYTHTPRQTSRPTLLRPLAVFPPRLLMYVAVNKPPTPPLSSFTRARCGIGSSLPRSLRLFTPASRSSSSRLFGLSAANLAPVLFRSGRNGMPGFVGMAGENGGAFWEIFGHHYSLPALNDPRIDKLPFSIRILLESAIRNRHEFQVTKHDVEKIIDWENTSSKQVRDPFQACSCSSAVIHRGI